MNNTGKESAGNQSHIVDLSGDWYEKSQYRAGKNGKGEYYFSSEFDRQETA